MSRRLYPHKRVRYWYAYDIDDICALFADLGLHPQTVRKWTKNGLRTIDTGKPTLLYGNDLIGYLKKNNTKNKCKTGFDQFFCMGCQDARQILQNKVSVKQKSQFLQARAVCRTCKKPMFKNYKLSDYSDLKKSFTLIDVLELYDSEGASGKTHIEAEEQGSVSEPLQMELL